MKPEKPEDIVPTPERMTRGEVVRIETIQAGVHTHIDRRSSLLDAYWRDQLLLGGGMDLETAAARHQAGLRLQLLYEATGFRKRVTGHYSPPANGSGEMTDDEAGAISAYNQIVRKLTAVSPTVASATVNLCIHDFDPVDRKELIRGLDLLVRHWGL